MDAERVTPTWFWYLLGFDPTNPADWPAMSAVAQDSDFDAMIERAEDER